MSDALIQISLSDQSMAAIEQWRSAPTRVVGLITEGLLRFLVLVENKLKSEDLRGGALGSPRGGELPLAVRSGRLLQALTHELTGPFEGFVGTSQGAASAYARAMLGPDATRITPKSAKHLWVPIAENAPPRRMNPMSPREVMEKQLPGGQRAAVIFRSKSGHLVVFLREGGTYQRGANKGRQRGKLMFVLKDEVELKPTDALAKAFVRDADEGARIMNEELAKLAA